MKTPEQLSLMGTHLTITTHGDKKMAPRYDPKEWSPLGPTGAVITEMGTQGNLPIVDFTFEDAHGNKYYTMLTGRLIQVLAAALAGTNVRNHGHPQPEAKDGQSQNH